MSKKAWAGLIYAMTLALTPSIASARDWPDTAGWTILEGDDYCGMTVEYEGKGDTQLTVGKFLDGHALLMLTNNGWSAKKDQKYDIQYYINKNVYAGKAHGMEADYLRKGFATQFGPEFFKDFAQGSSLKAYIGETLVDSLDLDGTAAAMVTVDHCLASVRATNAAAERERRRFDHIPDDPFAGPKAKPAPDEAAPESQWISADDYPPSSLRAVEEGTTTIAYTVNGQGRVENCVIKASSGSSALDRATCQAITRRGRFAPKTDSSGQAKSYERTFSYTWKQPSQS